MKGQLGYRPDPSWTAQDHLALIQKLERLLEKPFIRGDMRDCCGTEARGDVLHREDCPKFGNLKPDPSTVAERVEATQPGPLG